MNTLLLLSTLVVGGIWCALFLLFAFIGVHLIKLAKIGFDTTKNPPTPPNEHKKEPDGKNPSDTRHSYCFVARKKHGKTTVYKRLHFK